MGIAKTQTRPPATSALEQAFDAPAGLDTQFSLVGLWGGAGQVRQVVVGAQRRLGMAAIHQEVRCTILTTSMAGSSAYSCLPALVKAQALPSIPLGSIVCIAIQLSKCG